MSLASTKPKLCTSVEIAAEYVETIAHPRDEFYEQVSIFGIAVGKMEPLTARVKANEIRAALEKLLDEVRDRHG